MDAKNTGRIITALRKEKGWTQKDLAGRLYVSAAAVSKWERGLNYPDLSLMEPLAELLDISVSRLLGLEHESTEQVIRNLSELSEREKTALQKKQRKMLGFTLGTLVLFLLLSWLVFVLSRSDVLLYTLFSLGGAALFNLAAIILGLGAWCLAVLSIFSRHQEHRWVLFSFLSFLCCGAAIYIPTLLTDLIFRFEYVSTIEDTIWADHFGAAVLFLGTALFNLCSLLLHRKKRM